MNTSLDQVLWIHGSQDCALNTDPLLQVHRHTQGTYIFRVNKCFNFEGNFLYLLFGTNKAILFDTGSRAEHGDVIQLPLREQVERIINQWKTEMNTTEPELVVAHTHSHADHVSWDSQFEGRAQTTIIGRSLGEVINYFGLHDWPEGSAELKLGKRTLTIMPLPGHDPTHIAVYDPQDRILLTGDTLYPGLLTVRDWRAFRQSAARLAKFSAEHEVDLVLGNHIEMQASSGALYPIGSVYQPFEHALPLKVEHIYELHQACETMGDSPSYDVHKDFIIGAGAPEG